MAARTLIFVLTFTSLLGIAWFRARGNQPNSEGKIEGPLATNSREPRILEARVAETPDSSFSLAPSTKPDVPQRISGHVFYQDGSPACAARVRLVELRWSGIATPDQERITGSSGEFCFDCLPGTSYRVEAGSQMGFVDVATHLDFSGDTQTDDIHLTIPDLHHLTVTVVDTRGNPVSGVVVEFNSEEKSAWSSDIGPVRGISDTAGEIRQLVFNLDHVVVKASRAYPGDGHVYLLPPPIELPQGQDSIRLVVGDAALATGVVLSPHGRPLPDQGVATLRNGEEVAFTVTDAMGRFAAVVPTDQEVSLSFLPGVVSNWTIIEPETNEIVEFVDGRLDGIRAGDHDLRLCLTKTKHDRTVRIRVEDPDGRSVELEDVRVRDNRGFYEPARLVHKECGAEIQGMSGSEVSIEITLSGKNDSTTSAWLPANVSGVTPEGQEIVVRIRAGVRLSGVVLGPDGARISGARVATSRGASQVIHADSDGGFSVLIDPADASPIALEAWIGIGHGRLSARVPSIDPGTREIVIRLSRNE